MIKATITTTSSMGRDARMCRLTFDVRTRTHKYCDANVATAVSHRNTILGQILRVQKHAARFARQPARQKPISHLV